MPYKTDMPSQAEPFRVHFSSALKKEELGGRVRTSRSRLSDELCTLWTCFCQRRLLFLGQHILKLMLDLEFHEDIWTLYVERAVIAGYYVSVGMAEKLQGSARFI